MRKQKGFGGVGILLVIIAAVLVTFVAVPGIGTSITAFILRDPLPCNVAPLDPSCTCPEDSERMRSGGTYFCELIDKEYDPDSPTYASDVEYAAVSYLQENFPGCDMSSCNTGGAEWRISAGVELPNPITLVPDRITVAECWDTSQNILFARVYMDVEDGTVRTFKDADCINYYVKGQKYPDLTVTGYRKTQEGGVYSFEIDYRFVASGLEAESRVADWNGVSVPIVNPTITGSSHCTATASGNSVMVVCDAHGSPATEAFTLAFRTQGPVCGKTLNLAATEPFGDFMLYPVGTARCTITSHEDITRYYKAECLDTGKFGGVGWFPTAAGCCGSAGICMVDG